MAYGLYNVVELILDAMIYKYINTHAYFYSDSYWNEEDFWKCQLRQTFSLHLHLPVGNSGSLKSYVVSVQFIGSLCKPVADGNRLIFCLSCDAGGRKEKQGLLKHVVQRRNSSSFS